MSQRRDNSQAKKGSLASGKRGKHGHAHQHLAVGGAAMNLRHGGFARDVVARSLKASLGHVHKRQLSLCIAALQKIYFSHAQRALAVVIQREFGYGSGELCVCIRTKASTPAQVALGWAKGNRAEFIA